MGGLCSPNRESIVEMSVFWPAIHFWNSPLKYLLASASEPGDEHPPRINSHSRSVVSDDRWLPWLSESWQSSPQKLKKVKVSNRSDGFTGSSPADDLGQSPTP